MKKQFILEIEVDEENIAQLYPNYASNYQSVGEFIDSELPHPKPDTMMCPSDNDLATWGFEKRILSRVNYEPPYAVAESKLVDDVIEEIKKAVETGDLTAVDELLRFTPRQNLIRFLPEEQWNGHCTEEDTEVFEDYE